MQTPKLMEPLPFCVENKFVMAKSRVAPLKTPTLPKLKLIAALVATRLSNFIIRTFTDIVVTVYIPLDR